MLGIVVILASSWLILYLFEKKNLSALGFKPTVRDLKQLLVGFLFSALLCALVQYFDSELKSYQWSLNTAFDSDSLLRALWWDFRAVFTEELLFRGALLYVLMKRFGVRRGIFTSALAFGVYHWFSYDVLGSPIPMVVVLLGTGIMGYAWALAFAKSETLLLPLGLHLGWNVVHNTVFSKGPLGDLLLLAGPGVELEGILSLVAFLVPMIVPPLVTLVYVESLVAAKSEESLA